MKAIFHIQEKEHWKTLYNNLKNYLKEAGDEESDLLVLVNAEAILEFKEPTDEQTMKELIEKGVVFEACRNALKSYAIPEDSLIDGVVIVGAGVYELTKRQHEGYAYIRV